MKSQTSALELHYLLKELDLENSKVDQIYELDKKDYILQFHKTGIGKIKLRINPPSFFYATEYKPVVTPPKGFVMALRKHLKNSFLKSIEQIEFERIIKLEFDTKEDIKYIYIELFGKGNVILTDKDLNILAVAEHQRWTDRKLQPNALYTYPQREHNFLKLSKIELKKLVGKDKIGKLLATELGLGKTYSDEVLLMAIINKTKIKLTVKDITQLYKALEELRSRPLNPMIIKDGKNIVPFMVKQYEDLKHKSTETYNQAFDTILTETHIKEVSKASTSKYEKQLKKYQVMIEKQTAQIKKLNDKAEESQSKAEAMYNNYQIIDDVLKSIIKARETLSWKEIKTKLKGHKIVKEINDKLAIITIDIE